MFLFYFADGNPLVRGDRGEPYMTPPRKQRVQNFKQCHKVVPFPCFSCFPFELFQIFSVDPFSNLRARVSVCGIVVLILRKTHEGYLSSRTNPYCMMPCVYDVYHVYDALHGSNIPFVHPFV